MIQSLKSNKSILIALLSLAYGGLFFPLTVSNVTLALLLGFCLIKTKPREILITFRESYYFKAIVFYYLLQIIGLAYTEDVGNGLFVLEKKISLILVPVFLLPLLRRYTPDKKAILRIFGVITLISGVVLLLIAFYETYILHIPDAFYFENFSYQHVHYVYYSIYFATGSLFLINDRLENYKPGVKSIATITALCAFSLLLLTLVASKTGLIAFGLTFLYILYMRLPSKRVFAIAAGALFIVAAALLYANPTTTERFSALTKNLNLLSQDTLKYEDMARITDLNMRLLFWKIFIVHQYHDGLTLTGAGTGDAQAYMNKLFELPQYNLYGFVNWDSHNQWIFALLQLGVFGVMALVLLYGKYGIEGLLKGNVDLVIFITISLLFSFSESILESNKGIVFTALLFPILCAPWTTKAEEPVASQSR